MLTACLNRILLFTSLVCLLANSSWAQSSPVAAPSFALTSRVYVEGAKTPFSTNETLFQDGMVFDFQTTKSLDEEPFEVVIFDSRRRTMHLLDMKRKLQLAMPDLRLLKILKGVREETLKDKRTRFLVSDEFKEKIDVKTKTVTLTSPLITYKVKGDVPVDENILPVYFEFLDNFTRLQASDPRKLPPFSRIRLNQSVRRVGWIPERVEISVKANPLFKDPFQAHTTHSISKGLTAAQLSKINAIKKQWAVFERTTLSSYRGFKPSPRFKNPLKTANSKESERR